MILQKLKNQEQGQEDPGPPRISYSELKNWKECPYRHKLIYIDKLPYYSGNEYTAFGTAIHSTCEEVVLDESLNALDIFTSSFYKELDILKGSGYNPNEKLVLEMIQQAAPICKKIVPSLKDYFKDYKVFSVEEQILEDIVEVKSYGKKFKGFIDIVLKTKDDKYHIIDWKSCSWGWPSQKKTDSFTNYQLTYYKNYFAKKHKIDPKKIETYFALLKRTAKKENVEFIRVSSGPKKTTNALKVLENAVININNKTSIKNRLNCKYCKFYQTENCK